MSATRRRPFYTRGLVTFLMVTGFVVATVTGVVMFFAPAGRIANWSAWQILGLSKDDWTNIHIVTCTMFIVAGLIHLYFNWKPLKAYLYSRARGSLNRKWEMMTALALTAFIVVGSVNWVPPLDLILEVREWAKDEMWLDNAVAGTAVRSPARSTEHEDALRQVGAGIDAILDEAEGQTAAGETGKARAMPSDAAEEHIEGSGYGGGGGFGRMTIRDVAARHGLDYEEVRSRLAAQNIDFEEQETLRDIANRHGVTPGELGRLASGQ